MEYTNEFLAGMYISYAPCKILWNGMDRVPFDLKGVDLSIQHVLLCGDYSGGTHNVYQCGWEQLEEIKSEAKLALLTLSSMTDEDAIQVAKFVDNGFIGKNKTNVKRFGGEMLTINTNEVDSVDIVQIFYGRFFSIRSKMNGDHVTGATHTKALDFLRSKGYDCGYSGFNNGEFITVPSLIKEGLAENIDEI